MTTREQRRTWVLTQALKDELTMAEAADLVGLSARQLWRLRVAFERDPVQLRTANRRRPDPGRVPGAATLPWTPPPDHPWRRVRKGTKLDQQRLTDSLNS